MHFTRHVSIASDPVLFLDHQLFHLSAHSHEYTPGGRYPIGVSSELPAPILWSWGFLAGTHKLTTTVYHHGQWIAQRGHDQGNLLAHVCVPPVLPGPCWGFIMETLTSSRKAKFGAGAVRANGTPLASCAFFDLEGPPTPMLLCGTLPLPLAGAGPSVLRNSLLIGLHPVDLFSGWLDIAVTCIQSVIQGLVEEGLGVDLPPGIDTFLRLNGISLVPDFGGWAAALARLLGQVYTDYAGDPEFSHTPMSGPFGEASLRVNRDHATGDASVEQVTGVRAGSLVGLERRTTSTIDGEHGQLTHEERVAITTVGGGRYDLGFDLRSGGEVTDWTLDWAGGAQNPSLPWAEGTSVPWL